MSKPDWCPPDIWKSATKSLRRSWKNGGNAAEGAAHAILAEREACAQVAANFAVENRDRPNYGDYFGAGAIIATAIRMRGEA